MRPIKLKDEDELPHCYIATLSHDKMSSVIG